MLKEYILIHQFFCFEKNFWIYYYEQSTFLKYDSDFMVVDLEVLSQFDLVIMYFKSYSNKFHEYKNSKSFN